MRTLVRAGTVSTFFPPENKLTPQVAAFLIRADDIRVSMRRYRSILETEDDTPDRTYFLFFLLRSSVIAIFDAAEIYGRLSANGAFQSTISTMPEVKEALDSAASRLAGAMSVVEHIRNQAAAHIDTGHLAGVIRLHAVDQMGTIDVANSALKRRWGALQGLLGAMLSRRASTGLDSNKIGLIVDQCSRASMAVLELEGPIVLVYDRATGGAITRVR